MKRTRKLASLLLALVMVFALATTALATDPGTTTTTGTITVDNPVAGRTYTAYKIFDVVYDATKEHYSYTLDPFTQDRLHMDVMGYATYPERGLVQHNVGTSDQADQVQMLYFTTNEKFSPAHFAAYLKEKLDNSPTSYTGYELTKEGNVASVSGLPLGYYFVYSDTGALCNLTTTNPAVTIHDKNDMPFDKEADQTSVDVGQTVNYTVTGKVPDYSEYPYSTDYVYTVADTMSDGLTFKKDVKVMIADEDGEYNDDTDSCEIKYDVDGNPNSFTVKINLHTTYIGAAIKVTYSAVVNEKAIAKISKNEATLTYSNNPLTDTTSKTVPVVREVYSSKIVIDKYQDGNENTKLPGADFVLYKKGGTDDSILYYKWNDTAKKVEWVTEKNQATVMTTNDNGAATFGGIANGTYYLEETKAPAGYNQLTAPVEVKVNGGTTEAELSVTANVANSTGTLLPSTGGMGTTVFYVLGAVLVLGAVVLLVTKKRMSDANR